MERARLNRGLSEMLKGGVIMDVTSPEEAKIAEQAGACAVMALETIPADIREMNGVARMSSPDMIEDIMAAVSIPVMAKCRIGHFVEAEILQELKVDYVDESEVLTIADDENHIQKRNFEVPFVCGCRNLQEALRRISEGACMIRTKGEAGTGNVVEAVRQIRTVNQDIKQLTRSSASMFAKHHRVCEDLVLECIELGRLPVVNFAAGGIATPADAALCMKLGVDGVFVGSGIFKSSSPLNTARAIVQAVTYFQDSKKLLQVSRNIGTPMMGIHDLGLLKEKWAEKEAKTKTGQC